MTQQSLKNLDSFSRGYIEDVRSKVDFDTTLRATMSASPIANSRTLVITSKAISITDGTVPLERDNPMIGKIITGTGIIGTPRITSVSENGLTITIDQPQTIAASTVLTFSNVNSGIEQYELTGSTKRRSKEDIRIEDLVPEELLNYATSTGYGNNTTGGIREFMESYYKFMNLEEFTYKDELVFEDVVINNVATFRINDGKNNKFFQRNLVLTAEFADADGFPLLVGDVDGTPINSGSELALDDTSRLTVGQTYQIISLGDGDAAYITTGINNIATDNQDSWQSGDSFVAADVGTAYNATLGTNRVSVQLLVYPTTIDDILPRNITISNTNNLPGRLETISEPTGRTVSIIGLPPRLNNRKIVMKTFIYNYVDAGPSYRLNTLEDSLNINEAQEEFLDMMQKEIAPALDKTAPVNKRAIYEKIIDFYKVRGSTESIETFFKLLFNEQEVQVNYPWDNTLKPSSGVFDQQSAITTNYTIRQTIESSDNANNDLFARSVSVSGDSFVSGAPLQEAATIDILTDAASNAGSNNRTIPLDNTTGLQVGMVVTSVTDASNITSNSKIASIVDGVSIILDKNIAENIGNDDTIRFTGQVDAGAVYVFTTTDNGVSYSQEAKIVSSVGDTSKANDRFGKCVDLDGDTLAIGAALDETTTHNTASTGSVEIWTRSKDIDGANVWSFNNKLIPPSAGESFASGNESISLSGDYLAVGHKGFDADSATIAKGAVIIYKRAGSTWSVLQTIRPSTSLFSTNPLNKNFGETVVLKGKYLVVSFQDYSTSSIAKTGRVVVYIKNEATGLYQEDAILAPSNDVADQTFGYALDITNVQNGTPRIALTSKDIPYHTVYIFERSEEIDGIASWKVISSIPNVVASTVNDGTYGSIVRLSENNLLIGNPGFDIAGINDIGKVTHHEYDEATLLWTQKSEYRGDEGVANSNYGFSMDLSDDGKNYLIVGSPGNPDGSGTTAKGFVRAYNRPNLIGTYTTNAGFLSEKSIKVHDSDFYQKFSYVVKVGRNLSQWKEPFNKLVHPAGFKYFGEVLLVLQAVRNVLGDTTSDTTVGNDVYKNAYSASPAFRKTLSSMPGVQPGYVGIEDIGLLIEAVASTFGIIGIARTNKDAKLAIKTVGTGGGISAISIAAPGHGYPSAPAITIAGAGSGATATAILNAKGEVANISIIGSHTTFDISGNVANDSRTAGTYNNVTTGGSRSSGSGASGTVNIVVTDGGTAATNGVITSITLGNNAGSNYAVGEVITIPDSALGGGGGTPITFKVASVGTSHSIAATTTAIQTVAEESADDSLTGNNAIIAGKIGKLNSTSTGLFLIGLNNKSYTSTPTIVISPPDSINADGSTPATNIQATATLTRDATTQKITGFTITNPGAGYLNDATITVQSTPTNEKRAPDYTHKKIIPINHDDNINAVLASNNYFERKDYENPAFLGPKKFQGNFIIEDFTNNTILSISNPQINDGTLINKLNIQTSFIKNT